MYLREGRPVFASMKSESTLQYRHQGTQQSLQNGIQIYYIYIYTWRVQRLINSLYV